MSKRSPRFGPKTPLTALKIRQLLAFEGVSEEVFRDAFALTSLKEFFKLNPNWHMGMLKELVKENAKKWMRLEYAD